MKKLLALILAAALALSLVACGGGSGAGDTNTPSTPSTENGDTTSTDTPSNETENVPNNENEKESLLLSASEFSGQEFTTALNNNPLKAKQDHIGNAYIFTGFFNNITDTYGDFVLWMDGAQYDDFAQVNMSQEELININLTDIVRIVGIFEDYNNKVVISPAYLLDDNITFEVTGTISDKSYNGRKLLNDSFVTVIDGNSNINLGLFGEIRLDMTDIQNCNTGDYITVRGSITHNGSEISVTDITSYNIISEEEYYKMFEEYDRMMAEK